MTLGTPFVRLVTRGLKGIQAIVGKSLPAISLLGAPLLAVDVLLLGTPASTTMWGWLLPLLAFLALALRHVALAATVLVIACFVGGSVVFKDLVVLSALLTFLGAFASSSDTCLGLFGSKKLIQEDALQLPCRLMAVRTPGDEASGLIGLGQGLERVFHLAAGGIEALGQWFKRLYRLAGRRACLVAVAVLYLPIGVVLAVIYGWVRGIQRPPWEEVLGWAVGAPGIAVAAASSALILSFGCFRASYSASSRAARPSRARRSQELTPSRCLSLSRNL